MSDLTMPKLSDTMEEGTILQWLKADGDEVAKGEQIVEIETDKANMMVEAPESGRLSIIAQEGDTLPIGAPIGAIGGGSAPAAPAPVAPAEEPARAEALPEPGGETDEVRTNIPVGDDGTGGEIGMEIGTGELYPGAQDVEPAPAPTPEPVAAPVAQPPAPPAPEPPAAGDVGVRVKASPLARKLAEQLGVDIGRVRGSGPEGRVVRADVEAASRGEAEALRDSPAPATGNGAGGPPAAPERSPAPAPGAAVPDPVGPGTRTPLTRLQRTVARRMVESKQAAPHFYLERDVDATDAIALRRELVEAAPEGERPSLNDLIVRAVAMAASERPDAISRFDDDALVTPEGVHVGVAVAVERGLLVPVVRDAAGKRVGQIAAELRDLVARCRDGTITPAELEGGSITISNLGMFGIDRFAAIVNPPEAAILAVGRARPSAVVRDGMVTVRDLMTLTLSVDHRALYGAEGATFLGRIAELLERPHSLVL